MEPRSPHGVWPGFDRVPGGDYRPWRIEMSRPGRPVASFSACDLPELSKDGDDFHEAWNCSRNRRARDRGLRAVSIDLATRCTKQARWYGAASYSRRDNQ